MTLSVSLSQPSSCRGSLPSSKEKVFQIISLFAGAGGMDLGFEKAGFQTIWANDHDKNMIPSYRSFFPRAILDTRSIRDIHGSEIPKADGVIGGPPCQSWSTAGTRRGVHAAFL
jgi:DNA (cytosine-5)-methyltransferase 1